jgi:hypothetical protein
MSWAAHEFENYFIQHHAGARVSFLAVVVGTQAPDLFTKYLVYSSSDVARFHRGWPGVGFTHSFIFGLALAALVLAVTRSRPWALGILIGQWAHVVTDIGDTAGVMPFFPFSIEPVALGMWKHAGAEGPYGDAAAYYSSLGGAWDLFCLAVTLVVARRTPTFDYFRRTIVPADPEVWAWLRRHLRLSTNGLLLLYRGLFFYGIARMSVWFLYARFDARMPLGALWGGPAYLPAGNDLSDAGVVEVLTRTALGAVLFAACGWIGWRVFGRRLWERAAAHPSSLAMSPAGA